MAVESGRLVIEPELRKKYTLQELLAQCDASAPLSNEDKAWTSSTARGEELV
jgi:antitoxin ChpS